MGHGRPPHAVPIRLRLLHRSRLLLHPSRAHLLRQKVRRVPLQVRRGMLTTVPCMQGYTPAPLLLPLRYDTVLVQELFCTDDTDALHGYQCLPANKAGWQGHAGKVRLAGPG